MPSILAREFVFEFAPFASCHASTIVELESANLMAAWFGGTAEGNPDVAIWGSHRTEDHGWTAPVELAREKGVPCWNPVLFRTADGLLWLYYKFGPHPVSWTGARRRSEDGGRTWSATEYLPAGLYGPVRAKPAVLNDGTIVSGTSVETWRSWACWIERSTDGGVTWTKAGPVTVPDEYALVNPQLVAPPEVPGSAEWQHTRGMIQPSVVALAPEHLRLYARPTARIARVCVADSFDAGRTWTQARPLDLPNPNSGLDAVALADGRVVLLYNHSDTQRSPLNLAISDDGLHFRPMAVLESDSGEYSYPALIVGADGTLHMTWTWNRTKICYARVDPADVTK